MSFAASCGPRNRTDCCHCRCRHCRGSSGGQQRQIFALHRRQKVWGRTRRSAEGLQCKWPVVYIYRCICEGAFNFGHQYGTQQRKTKGRSNSHFITKGEAKANFMLDLAVCKRRHLFLCERLWPKMEMKGQGGWSTHSGGQSGTLQEPLFTRDTYHHQQDQLVGGGYSKPASPCNDVSASPAIALLGPAPPHFWALCVCGM